MEENVARRPAHMSQRPSDFWQLSQFELLPLERSVDLAAELPEQWERGKRGHVPLVAEH
jgi:hypothetical protein